MPMNVLTRMHSLTNYLCVCVSVQESGRWVKGGLTHQKHKALDFMPLAHSC